LPIATLPMLVMSWYLTLDPPPAKQLKRVGWTLVVGTIASAAWVTFVFTHGSTDEHESNRSDRPNANRL